jgi:hypothetical protein
MGFGGLVAIVGGVLFIVVVLQAIARRGASSAPTARSSTRPAAS